MFHALLLNPDAVKAIWSYVSLITQVYIVSSVMTVPHPEVDCNVASVEGPTTFSMKSSQPT